MEHRAFGLTLRPGFPLPGMPVAVEAGEPALRLDLATPAEVERLWSGAAGEPCWTGLFPDGCDFEMETGVAGDHRFRYGDHALFHLDAGRDTLLCAPRDVEDPAWLRVLLDSVLQSIALLEGYQALHAAAVGTSGGVVAIVGVTGGGKTSLVAELVRRGRPLYCDDVLVLSRECGRVVAHPGPPHMNVALERAALDRLGTRLATFDDEAWVAAANVATAPAPLRAIFLLQRSASHVTLVSPEQATGLDLLPHSMAVARGPERRRAAFELYSDIAAVTPVYRLHADLAASPAELADLLELALAETSAEAAA